MSDLDSEVSETEELFIDELFEAVQNKSALKTSKKNTKNEDLDNLKINLHNIDTFHFINDHITDERIDEYGVPNMYDHQAEIT